MRMRAVVAVVVFMSCQQGTKGETGTQGDVGPAGARGPAGAQGATGERGPDGARGATGDVGPVGSTGAPGQVVVLDSVDGGRVFVDGGLVIVSGPQGDVGPRGPAGADGQSGQAGSQGASGASGRDGDQFGERASSFAGFTSVSYQGNLGGPEAAHAACAAEFVSAHLCHVAEFYLSNTSADVPDAGAWTDPSEIAVQLITAFVAQSLLVAHPDSGRARGASCAQWTNNTVASAPALLPSGPENRTCNESRPLACCNTKFREKFAGFTVAALTGAQRGTTSMHAACAAEFAGSHFCRGAEYVRATVSTLPPVDGAWVDADALVVNTSNQGVITQLWEPSGIPNSGRLIGARANGSSNCQSWTSSTGPNTGFLASPSGLLGSACSTPHRIACCR